MLQRYSGRAAVAVRAEGTAFPSGGPGLGHEHVIHRRVETEQMIPGRITDRLSGSSPKPRRGGTGQAGRRHTYRAPLFGQLVAPADKGLVAGARDEANVVQSFSLTSAYQASPRGKRSSSRTGCSVSAAKLTAGLPSDRSFLECTTLPRQIRDVIVIREIAPPGPDLRGRCRGRRRPKQRRHLTGGPSIPASNSQPRFRNARLGSISPATVKPVCGSNFGHVGNRGGPSVSHYRSLIRHSHPVFFT